MMVVMEMCSRAPFLTSHVSFVHQGRQVTKALPAKRDLVDPRELLARMVKMEIREMAVCKDQLVCKGQLVHLALEVQLELLEDSFRSMGQPAHKVHQAHQEPQAKRECPVKMEQIPVVELDLPEIMVVQDHREHLGHKDHLVHKAPMERPAAASIARLQELLQAIKLLLIGCFLHKNYHLKANN